MQILGWKQQGSSSGENSHCYVYRKPDYKRPSCVVHQEGAFREMCLVVTRIIHLLLKPPFTEFEIPDICCYFCDQSLHPSQPRLQWCGQ